MVLTESQVANYQRDGFVIVENFFSANEVRAMVAELERFKRDGLIRNVATDGDGKTPTDKVMNLQVIPLNSKSDLFKAFPWRPGTLQAVEQLLGAPFVRYLDQIFLKPAGHGAGTSWHQDNAYFKITDPVAGVGMWTALHDANLENGTMELIPGVHDSLIAHDRDPGSDHHIRCRVDESKAVPVIVAAGGVVFFNYGVPHCTRANRSARERAGLAFHFLRTDRVPEAGVGKSIHVTGDQATGGEREYGRRVADEWNAQVARLAG